MLAAASDTATLRPVLAAFGFDPSLEPLDPASRAALGIPPGCPDAHIARGKGALRALVLRTADHVALRETVRRIAGRLNTATPHILWLLIVADRDLGEIAFAAWPGDRTPPRVAALLVRRERIVDSDAETACALAAAQDDSDTLTHARWLDILGRESVNRRFYRSLERLTGDLAASLPERVPADDRGEIALLCTSRLLFLSFLEAKGWLDGDRGFLARTFDECAVTGGRYHRRVLLPLLHGTLNTRRSARSPAARAFGRIPFLNGGLFARTPVERRHRAALFPDDTLGALFSGLLTRYRFTAREDSATWSEAAIDPEMLGKAFESIMASRERRDSGAFFTPQPLVERVTTAALEHALASAGFPDAVAAIDDRMNEQRESLRERLSNLRIVDPACGSGAFLVHALERIAALHIRLGDPRDIVEVRRAVLTRTIFGVDRNPFAVWLCELRLWLAMVIESTTTDPYAVPPLPNLDHHIRVGDALAGEGLAPFAAPLPDRPAPSQGMAISRLRQRYVRATGRRKRNLARELDRAERARAIALIESALASNAARRRDLLAALRSRDLFGERPVAAASDRQALETLRERARELRRARRAIASGVLPFAFPTHFADAASAGGFDVVVGNPPWVRLHRIPADARAALRDRFQVFLAPGWQRGATIAHASPGFAAQVDLAALFVERSLELLRPGGTLSLLLPSKLWHSLAGATVRRVLHEHATLAELEDLERSPHAFDAAVYPSVLVAIRSAKACDRVMGGTGNGTAASNGASASPASPPAPMRLPAAPFLLATSNRSGTPLRWSIDSARLAFDDDPASPWLIVPPEVRAAFDALTHAGTALAHSALGRPRLGVKCGCNAAFLLTASGDHVPVEAAGDIDVTAPGRRGRIERALVRPLLRGESLRPWRIDPAARLDRILWPHDAAGNALRTLPPLARHWLAPWRRRLIARTDGGGRGPWWTLFRTDAARNDVPRVVWSDIGRTPRAMVLAAGDPTVPINSCYVVRCPTLADAHALAALLNGPLAAAWLNVLAEPARGNFHRYLGWTTALLPVPSDWVRARSILAPIGERASLDGHAPTAALLEAALEAYGLDELSCEPLLTWTAS